MRIRMLATALVTVGALMGTLTGAANADGTPAPEDDVVLFTCEGGGQVAVRVRTLTRAEIEKMEKEGKVPAVAAAPAVPAAPSGAEVDAVPAPHGDAAVRVAPKPGHRGTEHTKDGAEGTDVTVMARPGETHPAEKAGGPERTRLALPESGRAGTPEEEAHVVLSEAVPAPGGEGGGVGARTETRVTVEDGEPVVTCTTKR